MKGKRHKPKEKVATTINPTSEAISQILPQITGFVVGQAITKTLTDFGKSVIDSIRRKEKKLLEAMFLKYANSPDIPINEEVAKYLGYKWYKTKQKYIKKQHRKRQSK